MPAIRMIAATGRDRQVKHDGQQDAAQGADGSDQHRYPEKPLQRLAEQSCCRRRNHQQGTDQNRADDFNGGYGDQRHQNHKQIIQRLHCHSAHRGQLRVEAGQHDAVVQRQAQPQY